jgi:hypothetical protein
MSANLLVRGAKNSCLVEFVADGVKAVTSRNAARKVKNGDSDLCDSSKVPHNRGSHDINYCTNWKVVGYPACPNPKCREGVSFIVRINRLETPPLAIWCAVCNTFVGETELLP